MSFKCSVFGHAYGDSEIEREREEDGSEVVTTIRETETCQRCGETRVVSENKEVTTLETAADIVAEDLDTEETDESPETDLSKSVGEPEPQPETESDEESEAVETPESAGTETVEEPVQDTGAEIVEETEAETVGAAEVVEAGEETDPDADDGVILEEDDEQAQADRQPGEWPEEPEGGDDEWEPETEIDLGTDDDGTESAGGAVTVPEGEFRCPECEFTTSVAESSLRRGDFCPECHRGALEHVTE
ncbi:hypothetical protein GRX03_09530 [Halovenus sp. WSH3]|uniref:Uncharacterized protein n=1 Tax=Halovenus carboxidivorans TaxID=2692199 RepID=A0A6B0T1K5_9EURY|nr:hypothetical protein [Halovenus carboxidivorans]MXR51845.1 hypothetical protein [Halovenus carboxidivorans]